MDSLTLFGHLFKTPCEAICIFLDFFTEKRGSHRKIYDFFGKVTKRIAFAGNFRYTVTRIAPAICEFCVLLPKQLTPRQGTKTLFFIFYLTISTTKQLTPRQGTKTLICCNTSSRISKQLTPRQGTKTVQVQMQVPMSNRNNLRPVRGRKRG